MKDGRHSQFISHTFPPGAYTVHVWGFDQQGDRADWTLTVIVTGQTAAVQAGHPGG